MNFNILKTTLLLAALTGLLMLIGNWLGGTAGLIVSFLLAAAMNFGSYWFSHQIALKMAGAITMIAQMGQFALLFGGSSRIENRSSHECLSPKPGQKIIYISADLRRPCQIGVSPYIAALRLTRVGGLAMPPGRMVACCADVSGFGRLHSAPVSSMSWLALCGRGRDGCRVQHRGGVYVHRVVRHCGQARATVVIIPGNTPRLRPPMPPQPTELGGTP